MSELELLEQIARTSTLRAGTLLGVGDDAAIIEGAPAIVATTDVLVEGVHFRRETTTLEDLGHKALAVNLSDVAAMGAEPRAALVGLVAPSGALSDADHAALRRGMDALASEHGVTIAGGDLSGGPALVLAVTAIGALSDPGSAVTRSGARPGDAIAVTGALGAAAAGLLVLERPELAPSDSTRDALLAAHRRPTPRVAEGRALAQAGAHAMLDCSDGLALDLRRMGLASGLRARLELELVPRARGVDEVAAAARLDAVRLAAAGGDDYELIVALPAAALEAARSAGVPLTRVGTMETGPAGIEIQRAGAPADWDEGTLGWVHDA